MKWCILGRHGFIGSALANKLVALGHDVTSNPSRDVNVVVHLASPTHLGFEENPEYHMAEAIGSFNALLPFCKKNDVLFIYASSALIYEPEKRGFFRECKLILEQMAEASGARTMGLRIFPVYGVGERRTAISQWCADMKAGKSPVIYGDGTQTRDFIYVDDVVDTIIGTAITRPPGIMDVGAGKPVSFNEIVETINKVLGTNIVPQYIPAPAGYSKGITCQKPVETKISLERGIRRILLGQ